MNGEMHDPPRVHFCGIGGTAMVAGARLANEAGWEVHGSDNPLYPPTSEMVAALGIPVAKGYRAKNLDWGPDRVIIGNVLSRGNPEVETVLDRRLHYISLPEWIKDAVLRTRRSVAICGTHGKTSTTALTAWLLDRAGLDPGYLIGGQPFGFSHSARLGRPGTPFVIEGDEYDTAFFDKRAKFFHYLPEIAVVTSLEYDHGDIYRDLEAIEQAFRWMLRQIPSSGRLILCADSPGAMALNTHAFCPIITYGFHECADYRILSVEHHAGMTSFTVHRRGVPWATFEASLVGRHNLQNAAAALAVADVLGASLDGMQDGLRTFPGVRRRMEIFHEAQGIPFIDDFAHHPTAVAETIAAARQRWPESRLRVLCEPRSNTMVTRQFEDALVEAFGPADELWIGPIYRADTIPEANRLDRAALVKRLAEKGIPAHYDDDVTAIVAEVHRTSCAGDVVLILSNGAFGGIFDQLKAAFPVEEGGAP